jgi:hypothetical protein
MDRNSDHRAETSGCSSIIDEQFKKRMNILRFLRAPRNPSEDKKMPAGIRTMAGHLWRTRLSTSAAHKFQRQICPAVACTRMVRHKRPEPPRSESLALSSALKMVVVCSSKPSVKFYRNTRRHTPQDNSVLFILKCFAVQQILSNSIVTSSCVHVNIYKY